MPEFSGGFDNGVLPKKDTPLVDKQVFNAVADALIGAAPGDNVTVNRTRIKHDTTNETKRATEQQTLINRNTNANDVTQLKARVIRKRSTLVFPADRSGNGGPSFSRA